MKKKWYILLIAIFMMFICLSSKYAYAASIDTEGFNSKQQEQKFAYNDVIGSHFTDDKSILNIQKHDSASDYSDADVSIVLNGNTFVSITGLVNNTDYVIKDSNTSTATITLKKSYLAALPVGKTKLTFKFNQGSDAIYEINVNNLAFNKAITDKSSELKNDGEANMAVDGVANTCWSQNQDLSNKPNGLPLPQYIVVDLGADYDISSWAVNSSGDGCKAATVFGKRDKADASFEAIDSFTGNSSMYVSKALVTPKRCRYIKLQVDNANGMGVGYAEIYEFEVYGTLSPIEVSVTGVSVNGANITANGGTQQMSAAVTPDNATNKDVTWTITSGNSYASISDTGLLTAKGNGTVTVRATSKDGSSKYGEATIVISGQTVPVTGVTVNGEGNVSTISTKDGTLQMSAVVTPEDATNKDVTWTITNGNSYASISDTGLLTAKGNGTVTVRAAAKDGSSKYGEKDITISGQTVDKILASIKAPGAITGVVNGAAKTIEGFGLPTTVTLTTDQVDVTANVNWDVADASYDTSAKTAQTFTVNGTVVLPAGVANPNGVSLAINVSVTVNAAPATKSTAKAISAFSIGSLVGVVNETNHKIQVTMPYGTALTALAPTIMISDKATVSPASGASEDFTNEVTYTVTAEDGTTQSYDVTVLAAQPQSVPVTGVTVNGANITTNGGTQQMSAVITPDTATNKNVTWTITNGNNYASISDAGVLTATGNGTVTVRATAKDGSGKYGEATIQISGQTAAPVTVEVTGIAISGANITTNGGTQQMSLVITPDTATNKNVTWTITNGNNYASISDAGVLTATGNGTVTVRATAKDGSGKYGEATIQISGQTAAPVPTTYSVTFGVTYAGTPLAGAMVTVNGTTYTTEANGTVTIPSLPNGTYYYSAACGGFNPQAGSFVISGSNTSVPISLTVYTAPANQNNNRDHDKKDNSSQPTTAQTTTQPAPVVTQPAAQPQAAPVETGAAVAPPVVSAPTAGTGTEPQTGSGTPAAGSSTASEPTLQTLEPYVAVVQASRSASEVQETVMTALTSGTFSQAEVQKLQTAVVDKVNKMNAVSAASAAAANTQISKLVEDRNELQKAFKAAGKPIKGLTDTIVVNVKPTAGTVLALNNQILSSLRSTGIVKVVVTSGNTTSVITLNTRVYRRASSITCTFAKVKGKLVPKISIK